MKKLCCLVLLLMFSLTTIALADEFLLRNGILFGDTMEDILSKEKTLVRNSETSNTFSGRISGINDSECAFGFDDDGKLKSMTYSFDCYSRDNTDNTYDTLYDGLVRKYGKAEGNTGGDCELITGPAISNMAIWVYLFGELDGWSADYYDYDEWIIDCADYYVKIDLVSYYYRNDDFEYTYNVELSYLKYTEADYQSELDKKKNEREEVDDDL